MPSFTEHEQDSSSFQLCCTVIDQTVPSSTRADTVVANATTKKVNEQKHFQNACSLSCHYTVLLMSGGDLRPPSPVICKSHEL